MAEADDGGALEGVSREEFTELATAVGGLRDAMDELRSATTVEEKREAKADVAEAKGNLDDLARQLNISPKALKDAAAQAQRNERKEELRPLLVELLDEELADTVDDATDAVKDAVKGEKPKPEPKEEPKEDTVPLVDHWVDKGIGALFGRE